MNTTIQFSNIFLTSLLFEILQTKTSEQAIVITGCEGMWSTHSLKPRTRYYALRVSLLKSSYLFLDAFVKLRKVTLSFIMSVRPSAWNNLAPTGRILVKFYV